MRNSGSGSEGPASTLGGPAGGEAEAREARSASATGKSIGKVNGRIRTGGSRAALRTLLLLLAAGAGACARDGAATPDPGLVRVLVDFPPATLSPRQALDAPGQRIAALLFSALTRIDPELEARPDLAASWRWRPGTPPPAGTWVFTLAPSALGRPVRPGAPPLTVSRLAACLEEYRVGKPISPYSASFPAWKGTTADETSGEIRLAHAAADPYFPRNASLLRYFEADGVEAPCREGDPDATLRGAGPYRAARWELAPETEFELIPQAGDAGAPRLRLHFQRDHNTKVLLAMRGEVDVALNTLSLPKTRWLQSTHPDRFRTLEREGVTVSYLGFNLRDPKLKDRRVRRALALAIDRPAMVEHKMFGFGSLTDSVLSPRLAESAARPPLAHNRAAAARLLDEAGLRPGPDGVRLRLRYKCTSAREGIEAGLFFRDEWRKIGVELALEIVEPAVFLPSIRKGAYQLFSGRWVGIGDASILARTLESTSKDNRWFYADVGVDRMIAELRAGHDDAERARAVRRIEDRVLEDLPYFPLWFWHSAIVMDRRLTGLEAGDLSLSGALEPLAKLRWAAP